MKTKSLNKRVSPSWIAQATSAVLLVAATTLLSSCERQSPDFYVQISGDTNGVKPGSLVIYRGAEAGSVTKLQPVGQKFRVEVQLKPEFRNQILKGARARAVNGLTTQFTPQLVVFPAHDPNAACLRRGEEIAEGTPLDSILRNAPHSIPRVIVLAGVGFGALLIAGIMLRGLIKLGLLIAVVSVPLVVYSVRTPDIRSPSEPDGHDPVQALIGAATDLLRSPQTRDVWQRSENEVRELLRQAQQGSPSERENLKRQLKSSIEAWKSQVRGQAAQELDKLKKLVETFGDQGETDAKGQGR